VALCSVAEFEAVGVGVGVGVGVVVVVVGVVVVDCRLPKEDSFIGPRVGRVDVAVITGACSILLLVVL
jgi:hypothetical protein